MVFTSTDLVFDGRNPPYSETDPVSPVNVYGRHKAEAEAAVHRIYKTAVVRRLPLMSAMPRAPAAAFWGP